jgi:hypothetical protein
VEQDSGTNDGSDYAKGKSGIQILFPGQCRKQDFFFVLAKKEGEFRGHAEDSGTEIKWERQVGRFMATLTQRLLISLSRRSCEMWERHVEVRRVCWSIYDFDD